MSDPSPTTADPSPSMSDPSPSATSMEEDEGKGMKRKNDDSNALLPKGETQDQQDDDDNDDNDDDVQMQDVAVASPNKVDDDQAKMETLKKIIEKVLVQSSNDHVRTEWNKWKDVYLLSHALGAYKQFKNKENFVGNLEGSFRVVFGDDEQLLAKFVAGVYAECVRVRLIVESETFSTRVVTVTHGLDQNYLGTFDLEAFKKHIHKVFDWHERGHEKFLSPSFAMVQSSGMGKTKLMREYTRTVNNDPKSDVQCKMILCMKRNMLDTPANFADNYSGKLIVPGHKEFTDGDAADIRSQLGKIEGTCTKTRVIFFFDEAHILPGSSVGAYHTVLWWLRQDRKESYLGVFAGTLLGLSRFQAVNEPSGFSRDAIQRYKNDDPTKTKLSLYAPFYSLTTISIARCHTIKNDYHDGLKDIRKHGCNGRPLFAAMLTRQSSEVAPALTLSDMDCRDGVITNPTMYNILVRVLLSPHLSEWTSNNDSIASVLGTRVQLGLTNYDFVNKATSGGYAILVKTPESDDMDQWNKFGSVAIAFPPDPVCAALAMGMMQPRWALRRDEVDKLKIQGEEPEFWVQKMATLFDQHFCLPERGDSGEVFAALYMLLCGDTLRFQKDSYMRLFEVDLEAWLLELQKATSKHPKPTKRPKLSRERGGTVTQDLIDTTGCQLSLNFIQVCRNYFRSHAWFRQSMLEYMYDTATACYVYPLCPAIDIVFPIKKMNAKSESSFHPCLVSVKCWDSIGLKGMKDALTSMKNYLNEFRVEDDKSTSALCLLLVIGTSRSPRTLPTNEGIFPTEDSFISILVPSSDKFGVNTTITNMAGPSHISELLASHSFAYTEEKNALRCTATQEYKDLGGLLLADKQELWNAQKQTTL